VLEQAAMQLQQAQLWWSVEKHAGDTNQHTLTPPPTQVCSRCAWFAIDHFQRPGFRKHEQAAAAAALHLCRALHVQQHLLCTGMSWPNSGQLADTSPQQSAPWQTKVWTKCDHAV